MIQYNTLSLDGDTLTVDIEVEDKDYYSSVYLVSCRIDTQDTYGKKDAYERIALREKNKQLQGAVTLPAYKNSIFIITPQTLGSPSEDTPCGKDVIDKKILFYRKSLQDKGLVYLGELSNTCTIPKGFIDYILKCKALDLSIDTCNIESAIKYWNMLSQTTTTSVTTNCGCNGLK